MSRLPSNRTRLQGQVLAAAVAFAFFAFPFFTSPVEAGIGNPLKKAKEKLQKAAEKKAGVEEEVAAPADNKPVVFDDVALELTEARIQNILATLRKAAKTASSRAALVEKRNKPGTERDDLWEKEGEKIRELERKRGDIETCQHDGFQAARDRRSQEYTQRALTDPALLEKFKQLAMQNNAAASQGDSAAQARLHEGLMSEMLPTKEDSAAVRRSCGPIPPRSAAESRVEALDKEIAAFDEQIRALDDKVAASQSSEGGLTREQWGMAIDRIEFYLSATRGKSGGGDGGGGSGGSGASPAGFTRLELDVLAKHDLELRSALGS